MKRYLDLIDRNTTGNRCDVTPLFADPAAFAEALDDLVRRIGETPFDVVIGVDALGFILGTGVALRMGMGLVVVRKGGKLPVACDAEAFVDYTGQAKRLEMRFDALRQGMRVLIVDEWVETGAQIRAVAALVERRGAVVAGVAAINIDAEALPALGAYPCFHLHAGV
jgi:adenine phosphoribosyltransferase